MQFYSLILYSPLVQTLGSFDEILITMTNDSLWHKQAVRKDCVREF